MPDFALDLNDQSRFINDNGHWFQAVKFQNLHLLNYPS